MKDRIYRIMKESGMNQKEFAQATGISTATVSSIFNGRTSATLNHALALHRTFPNLRMEWLMFGEGDMYSTPEDASLGGPTTPDLFSGAQTTEEHASEPTSTVTEGQTSSPIASAASADASTGTVIPSAGTIREVIKYIDKPARKITEIRIFFDDGTYEAFPGKLN